MDKKVYGVRICRQCKGLCHEGAVRMFHGLRKMYFCSEMHADKWIKDRYGSTLEHDFIMGFFTHVHVVSA